MAIPTTLERVSYDGPNGSIQTGAHVNVISGVGATRTLLAKESGSLCLLDSASGNVFTLPAPQIGMQFEFEQTVTVTSNAAKVITDSASTFLLGSVEMIINTSATTLAALADGTTHRAIASNGTTTGGVQGSRFKVIAISSTQWVISGLVSASGVLATPFATS